MIKGKWHDQGSAAQHDAVLHLDGQHFTIEVHDGRAVYGAVNELVVSDRLGNVERKLTLTDGSVFATRDNDAVDSLTKNSNAFNGLLHRFESSIAWVAVALIITIATTGAFFKWGLPWTSNKLAHALPHKTNEIIAGHTLDFLDEYFFEEYSDVDPEKAEQIRRHFFANLVPLEREAQGINYQLHFRNWEFDDKGIPNALALPSGDIILTDKFVELCENQNEMDSVLLHEMGHVVHRHSLQMLIQGTLISTIIMVATGDSNGLADFGLGLGSVLIASSYSRGHESEADVYAFEKMLTAGIDPKAFSAIMGRMTQYMEELDQFEEEVSNDSNQAETAEQEQDQEVEQTETKVADESETSILDYLSSHPNTSERIELANHYSNCFNDGLEICPPLIQE